jgi:putative oxidoreductase
VAGIDYRPYVCDRASTFIIQCVCSLFLLTHPENFYERGHTFRDHGRTTFSPYRRKVTNMIGTFRLALRRRLQTAAIWAPLPLRLIVGYGFMEHGYAKLARGPEAFATILQAMGVPSPHFMAWCTILTELIGGFAVLLGAFVTLASAPMVCVLLVATFKTQLPYGFSSVKLLAVTASGAQFGQPGYEVNLLYIACLAALVLGGPGPFALDNLIFKRSRSGNPQTSRTLV